jgi:hypothetical protein
MATAILAGLLVGTAAESRVFPLKLPQDGQLPAITYQQISNVRREGMGGTIPVERVRVQVDAWAETYKAVRSLGKEIDDRLNRYKGTIAGIEVLDTHRLNETEMYESDTQRRRITADYIIIIRREA